MSRSSRNNLGEEQLFKGTPTLNDSASTQHLHLFSNVLSSSLGSGAAGGTLRRK